MPVLIPILFSLCDSDSVWRFQLKLLSPIFECVQYYYMTWSSPMREGLDNEVDILKTQSTHYCESKVVCSTKPTLHLIYIRLVQTGFVGFQCFNPYCWYSLKNTSNIPIDNGSSVNRIQATVPLTGQGFGVIFLRGHISLKNRS
jgi:hypothetical protein